MTNRAAYICTPDRKIVCRIKGITSFNVADKGLNDFSTISFVVQKYITNQSTLEHELNESYARLHAFCEIYIPEMGYYLINSEPTINSQGEKVETKEFTAGSYESVLQYENLVGFKVNQGTETSVEMDPDNLDEMGIPRKMIRLWDEDPKFSLVDLILRDDYYGWSVGYIDPTLKTVERAFDVDNQNIYSFLCTDVAQAFRCVVTFDTVSKLINFYDIETYGRNTNIYLSLSHFLESINISPRSEDIYTVFNVAGENELDISRVNFGSNKIVNIDYPLSLLDADIQHAYAEYTLHRNSLRESYADYSKEYAALQEQIDAIMDRQPMDIIYNNWSSTTYYPTEDLQNYLQVFQAVCTTIEGLYKDSPEDEDPNMETLNASPDAAMYHSYKDVAIPDIEAELEARAADPPGHNPDPIKSEFVFEMFGLNDLEVKKITYEDRLAVLREGGYDEDEWDPASTISHETWTEHHAEYLEYAGYLDEITDLIDAKQEQVDELQAQVDYVLEQMADIAYSASLEGCGEFTDDQIKVVRSLYRESDYQDSNYGITEIDDPVSIAVKSQELYTAAEKRLEVESAPQFTWTVGSADLFSMREFESLKDSLKVGDFITLGFDTYGIAPIIVEQTEYKPRGIKFRVVEIDYDMLTKGANFNIVFSDMTQTRGYRDDFETLLQNAVASKTNAITVGASSTAASVAAQVTASLIKPYIEAQNAKIDNALLTTATIQDLTAVNANIETLVANVISTDEFIARVASIVDLSVFDLRAEHITTDKSITLVSDETGKIVLANSTMQFIQHDEDEDEDYVRVQIGHDGEGNYSVNIFSEPDQQGHQTQLWGSSGLEPGAIADNLIVNDMVNWTDVGATPDQYGKPNWNASKVLVDGGTLEEKWSQLKSVEIKCSSQVFTTEPQITLTPVLHMLENNHNLEWSYRTPTEANWTVISSTTASTTAPYLTVRGEVIIPSTATKYTADNSSLLFKLAYKEGGVETYSDVMTIFKLPDMGYTIVLSNEAQTIGADPSMHPQPEEPYYSCDVSVYRGKTKLTAAMPGMIGSNEYYITGSLVFPGTQADQVIYSNGVSLQFNTAGTCKWIFNDSGVIPRDFQIQLRVSIGGMQEAIIRYISISAAVEGDSPITVEIDSTAGNIFRKLGVNTTLYAIVKYGNEDITNDVRHFIWKKYDKDGNEIIDQWPKTTTTNSLIIGTGDVEGKAVIKCEVDFEEDSE